MKPPIEFFALGEPKGQPRVKAFVRGRHAGVYDPGTADGWKQAVVAACPKIELTAANEPYFTGPVLVTLSYEFPRPASHHVAGKRERPLKDSAPYCHTGKPDADNAAKAVLDALQYSGLWRDDAQVADLIVRKRYANGRPGCWVKVEGIE